jgi:hypothetical protein
MMSQRAPAQRNVSQISCVHHHSARESILRTNLESREPDAKGQNGMKLAKMIQKCKKCKEHTRRAIYRFYRRWKSSYESRQRKPRFNWARLFFFQVGGRTTVFVSKLVPLFQNQVDAERGHAHLLHAHTGHTSM